MATTAVLRANSELVARAFVSSLNLGPSASYGVGTILPEDKNTWKDGFVQVQIVGGQTDMYVPTRKPMIQCDVYVPSINSSKPQWGRANNIVEGIINAAYVGNFPSFDLDLGTYPTVRVQSMYIASEPRRIYGDPGGHARYTMDIVITWVAI